MRFLDKYWLRLTEALSDEYGEKQGAVLLVYFFHHYVRRWFKCQARSEHPVSAKIICAEINQFLMKGKIKDLIPSYHRVPFLRAYGVNKDLHGGGDRPTGSSTTKSTERRRLPNPDLDACFQKNTPLGVKISNTKLQPRIQELKQDPSFCIPTDPVSGSPRCLSWHLKGFCFSNCSRIADHKALSASEMDELHDVATKLFP